LVWLAAGWPGAPPPRSEEEHTTFTPFLEVMIMVDLII
jgi:hypothetical protein